MKRWVLAVSFTICFIALAIFLINKIQGPCSVTQIDFSKYPPPSTVIKYCDKAIIDFIPQLILQFIAFTLFPFLSLFLLTILTYRMKEEVFHAWWNFARWFVPLIIVTTLWLETAGGGGTLGMNKDFEFFILGILYSIFIITSLVKIMRAYISK